MLALYCLLSALVTLQVAAQSAWPNITLPWGIWQAEAYNSQYDYYIWKNIRFGKAPTNDLRFRASVAPDTVPKPQLQNNTYGPVCFQVNPDLVCGGPRDIITALPPIADTQGEDCLFLDLYVPRRVLLKQTAAAPVVNWIFGGAYVYGGKAAFGPDIPFYTGDSVLQAAYNASQNAIFVASNYRVGAFGWLAGKTMEAQGTPNAGLYDQRLVLQWIQKYISQVNGDTKQVSAWGESAGAGSIVHHLTSHGGTQDPLFSKAIVQSPAFEWQWSRSGTLEGVFTNFTLLSECRAGDISCLRAAPVDKLKRANQLLFQDYTKCTGIFDLGPSVDGKLIRELPAVAFQAGNYWKNLDSFVVSHVEDEASSFTPANVNTWDDFTSFIARVFDGPRLAKVRAEIYSQYHDNVCEHWDGYDTPQTCLTYVIQDAFFVCNTRQLFDAFSAAGTSMWMMQYDFLNTAGGAKHSYDLMPTFYHQGWNLTDFVNKYGNLTGEEAKIFVREITKLAAPYQSYFMSHAVSGDPNTYRSDGTVQWLPAYNNSYGALTQVMEVSYGFIHYFTADEEDDLNTSARCYFWNYIAKQVMAATESRTASDDDRELVVQGEL